MNMAEYITRGLTLWVIYLGVQVTASRRATRREAREDDQSWSTTFGLALVAWLAVMTWPVTLSLTLVNDLWRPS